MRVNTVYWPTESKSFIWILWSVMHFIFIFDMPSCGLKNLQFCFVESWYHIYQLLVLKVEDKEHLALVKMWCFPSFSFLMSLVKPFRRPGFKQVCTFWSCPRGLLWVGHCWCRDCLGKHNSLSLVKAVAHYVNQGFTITEKQVDVSWKYSLAWIFQLEFPEQAKCGDNGVVCPPWHGWNRLDFWGAYIYIYMYATVWVVCLSVDQYNSSLGLYVIPASVIKLRFFQFCKCQRLLTFTTWMFCVWFWQLCCSLLLCILNSLFSWWLSGL